MKYERSNNTYSVLVVVGVIKKHKHNIPEDDSRRSELSETPSFAPYSICISPEGKNN